MKPKFSPPYQQARQLSDRIHKTMVYAARLDRDGIPVTETLRQVQSDLVGLLERVQTLLDKALDKKKSPT